MLNNAHQKTWVQDYVKLDLGDMSQGRSYVEFRGLFKSFSWEDYIIYKIKFRIWYI